MPRQASGAAGDLRKQQILEAAAEVFSEYGFGDTGISTVARAVKLTKAGLYHHIYSKEQLLSDIMNYAMDLTNEIVVEPVSQIKDPLEQLKELIEKHLEVVLVLRPREVTVVLHENKSLKGAQGTEIDRRKKEYIRFVERILSNLAKKYGTRRVNVKAATFSLLGMLNWCYQWYNPKGHLTPKVLARDFTAIFLYGFLKSSPLKKKG